MTRSDRHSSCRIATSIHKDAHLRKRNRQWRTRPRLIIRQCQTNKACEEKEETGSIQVPEHLLYLHCKGLTVVDASVKESLGAGLEGVLAVVLVGIDAGLLVKRKQEGKQSGPADVSRKRRAFRSGKDAPCRTWSCQRR